MATAKDDIRKILDHLPDDASYEDVQYHIYVVQKVQRALRNLEEGQVVPHEVVVRRMVKWLKQP